MSDDFKSVTRRLEYDDEKITLETWEDSKNESNNDVHNQTEAARMANPLDDLDDISETDPIRVVIAIDKKLRPTFDSASTGSQTEIVFTYAAAIRRICGLFDLEFDVPLPGDENVGTANTILYQTKLAVDLKKIDLIHARVSADNSVVLDDNWRGRIHAYIAHIRPIVERAALPIGLRDSILQKLNDLAAEIDRSRTRVRVFSDVLIELCTAVGTAANELRPAVILIERIVGAITRLHSGGAPMLSLPAPDGFGLDQPEEVSPPLAETSEA